MPGLIPESGISIEILVSSWIGEDGLAGVHPGSLQLPSGLEFGLGFEFGFCTHPVIIVHPVFPVVSDVVGRIIPSRTPSAVKKPPTKAIVTYPNSFGSIMTGASPLPPPAKGL